MRARLWARHMGRWQLGQATPYGPMIAAVCTWWPAGDATSTWPTAGVTMTEIVATYGVIADGTGGSIRPTRPAPTAAMWTPSTDGTRRHLVEGVFPAGSSFSSSASIRARPNGSVQVVKQEV